MTSPPGTLVALYNAVVNVGGEIEKAHRFVPHLNTGLSAASKGLFTWNRQTYVVTANALDLPPDADTAGHYNVNWPGHTLAALVDWDIFDNIPYLVLEDTLGNIQHFYNHNVVPAAPTAPMSEAAQARYIRTFNFKIYAVRNGKVFFCAVGNPLDWTGTGSGYIDLSSQDADSTELTGVEVYYDKLAIFGRSATQLWSMNADPSKNQWVQTLRHTGSYAPQSIRQHVGNDLLYLQTDGIRSLRAREGTVTAMTADVGSPIDPLIQGLLRQKGEAWMARAIGVLHPRSGRFWMIFPDRIYVLSQYLSPKILAWSVLDVPEELVAAAVVDTTVLVRASDGTIYLYSDGGTLYTERLVQVWLPFLPFDKPATTKVLTGLDIACEGQWDVSVFLDPDYVGEEQDAPIGSFTNSTFMKGKIPLTGRATHFLFKFTNWVDGAPATLGKVFIHYEEGSTT